MNDDLLEQVDGCPFCTSDRYEDSYRNARDIFFKSDPGAFDFARCRSCSSLWLKQRPAGERLLNAYAQYYTHSAPRAKGRKGGVKEALRNAYAQSRFSNSARLSQRIAYRLISILGRDNSNVDLRYRFAPRAPSKLLDYGCGNGDYLLLMQPLGYALNGVEFDPQLLTNLSETGIEIEDAATVEDARWIDEFDHITLAHVIEHVPDPIALLQRLFRWLKPGGSLFIEVPNANATGLAIFHGNWRGLEVPRHFALPTRQALAAACEGAGFLIEMQHINRSARQWVWQESLESCDPNIRCELMKAMEQADVENADNAEFITLLVRKPEKV